MLLQLKLRLRRAQQYCTLARLHRSIWIQAPLLKLWRVLLLNHRALPPTQAQRLWQKLLWPLLKQLPPLQFLQHVVWNLLHLQLLLDDWRMAILPDRRLLGRFPNHVSLAVERVSASQVYGD